MRPPGRLPAHEVTTAALPALHPLHVDCGRPPCPPFVGQAAHGGPFGFDPFRLYRRGEITNPNVLVLGQIGRGKSALVKTWLWRMALTGVVGFVVDPKGEYGALARAWGVEVTRLAPGSGTRLNPLEVGGGPGSGRARARELLTVLAEVTLGRPAGPREHAALDAAVASSDGRGTPTLSAIVSALLDPGSEVAHRLRTTEEVLREDGRDLALALGRLLHGELGDVFAGASHNAPAGHDGLVVVDLSRLHGSSSLGLLMLCALAWLDGQLLDGRPRIVVLDEAWALLESAPVTRWLRASWKLARARGVAHVAVLHRLGDLRGAGDDSTAPARMAEALLADSETRIVLGQAPEDAADVQRALGLSDVERDLLPRLARGDALWQVGRRTLLVHHRIAAGEWGLVDTDDRMRTDG